MGKSRKHVAVVEDVDTSDDEPLLDTGTYYDDDDYDDNAEGSGGSDGLGDLQAGASLPWSGAVGRVLADCGLAPKRSPPKGPVLAICVGVSLWGATFVLATLGVLTLMPDPAPAEEPPSHSKTPLLEEVPPLTDVCPCSCQESARHGGPVVPTPVEELHSKPIAAVLAPLPTVAPPTTAEPPAPPELPSVGSLPTAAPPSTPRPPQVPTTPAPLLMPGLPGLLGPTIEDGTPCLAKKAAPVFASLTSWREVGRLHAGQVVVAAGPPEIVDGYVVLPTRKPRGAVEVAVLKFENPPWECHPWDFADKAQPRFELISERPNICERFRADGYEYRYALAGMSVLAPGCGDCWCCRRKKLVPDTNVSRRLLPDPILGVSPVSAPGDLLVATTTPMLDLIVTTTTEKPTLLASGAPATPIEVVLPGVPALTPPPVEMVTNPPLTPAVELGLQTLPPPPTLPPLPTLPTASLPSLQLPSSPSPLPRDKNDDEAGACRAGDTCAYGQTWCAKQGHHTMVPAGNCTKRKCDGPDGISTFPNHTCNSPSLPSFNMTHQLEGLPEYVRKNALSDIPWLNGIIRDALVWHGLTDFTIELDDVLTQSFQWQLVDSQATWLVGCWPPQRYLVTDGWVRFPSGRIVLRIGSVHLVVSVYNLEASFRNLRADIECHGGWFYLGSVGKDQEGFQVTADRFTASGEVNVQCETGWTAFCIALMVAQKHISQEVIRRLPALLAAWLGGTSQLALGPGCPGALHNMVSVMSYSSKECCEDRFAIDHWGCLVGGQFNGRHRSQHDVVYGVECESSSTEPNKFVASCDSIPGTYSHFSPGICRESSFSTGTCTGCSPGWPTVLSGLSYLTSADMFLTLALWWCSLASCCVACGTCGGLTPGPYAQAAMSRLPSLQQLPRQLSLSSRSGRSRLPAATA